MAVIDPRRVRNPKKMWRFAESRRLTQNVNKVMWANETSHQMHRAHSTCVRLQRWKNQRRLSSLDDLKVPVVAVMLSVFSLHRTDNKVVFPALVRPRHTSEYSAFGVAGVLQHSR